MDNKILLVDSCHGVYTWHNLASRYPLFVGNKHIPLAEYLLTSMPDETIETVFHPDNPQWCENIDYMNYIYVQNNDGTFWLVQQDEDIWAINPEAVWSEEEEDYIIE